MKTASFIRDPSKVILLAPLILVFHVLEEYSSFVSWLNSVLEQGSVTQPAFIVVNFSALLFTILITVILNQSRIASTAPAFLALVWLSFLMFGNALFHVIATAMLDTYSPGTITSIILYFPFFIWVAWAVMKKYKIRLLHFLFAVLGGSFPWLIFGYFLLIRREHPFSILFISG